MILCRREPRVGVLRHLVAFATFVNLVAIFGVPNYGAGAAERTIRIVAFGDSLTAGFLLKPEDAFPVQLQRALTARGHRVEVLNAGVSGDTTAAGLGRIDWAIPEGTDAVILELGANDALRGQDPAETKRNLDAILSRLRASGAQVLVAGMRAPSNWGPEYQRAFDPIFAELAEKHDALLYPFFLDGVLGAPELILEDGLHPNAGGVAEVVRRILPKAEELIGRVETTVPPAASRS